MRILKVSVMLALTAIVITGCLGVNNKPVRQESETLSSEPKAQGDASGESDAFVEKNPYEDYFSIRIMDLINSTTEADNKAEVDYDEDGVFDVTVRKDIDGFKIGDEVFCPFDKYGGYSWTYDLLSFRIIDLDKNDKAKNVFIAYLAKGYKQDVLHIVAAELSEQSPNGFIKTLEAYMCDDGELDDVIFYYDEHGSAYLSKAETYFGLAEYTIRDIQYEMVELQTDLLMADGEKRKGDRMLSVVDGQVFPITSDNCQYVLSEDCRVYSEASKDSKMISLKQGDVEVICTNGKDCFQIKDSKGNNGWIFYTYSGNPHACWIYNDIYSELLMNAK